MILLGIETSCDETSCAVIESQGNKLKIISNVISSSVDFHSKTGGIIPEVAAREQIKAIIPVIKEAFSQASLDFENPQIDAIAVTYGPGLIGSLLVGIETAKTLSVVWKKPIIPVNHLIGHIYANFLDNELDIKFPSIGLIVSGGHTDLVLIKSHKEIRWIGGTRDDAAGEAFDKTGRMLGLPYPAGPQIEKLAREGKSKIFNFPRPLIYDKNLDFSFSGLKTAVFREVSKTTLDEQSIRDICTGIQNSIADVLITKTINAAKKYNVKSILLGGGVAANQFITDSMRKNIELSGLDVKFFVPRKVLCTDNGAMIAASGFFHNNKVSFEKVNADPSLYF